jgi:hypothetical protein
MGILPVLMVGIGPDVTFGSHAPQAPRRADHFGDGRNHFFYIRIDKISKCEYFIYRSDCKRPLPLDENADSPPLFVFPALPSLLPAGGWPGDEPAY